MMPDPVLVKLLERLRRGQPCVMATLVHVAGSAPRRPGARMLVFPDGTGEGTIGGGALEAAVVERAARMRSGGEPVLLRFDLGADLGMLCGGRAEVFLEPFAAAARLVIFGAGHIGRCLAPLAASAGFSVTIVDDREKLACAERIPQAEAFVHSLDPERWDTTLVDGQTCCVVATRGHETDTRVVLALLRGDPPMYVGMIGSATKRREVERVLRAGGVPEERLALLHTPVGVPIGAETPEEIALSIAAELVMMRRAPSPRGTARRGGPEGRARSAGSRSPSDTSERREENMTEMIDTLLLLALPASGKSEVRKYLSSLTPEHCRETFRIGPTVQLDDFPYVHFMRRVDEELAALGREGVFFLAADRPFRDPWEWGTLIHLLNEDHEDLLAGRRHEPASASEWMLDRLDRARRQAGRPPRLAPMDSGVRAALARALEAESRKLLRDKTENMPGSLEGKTVVLEFARGGKDGASMPLDPPFGYQYSLSQLSDSILSRASVLYIWVTPEESRRKNVARTDPNDPGSILHHGTPAEVMFNDYGCDDIAHLLETSGRPGAIRIDARGRYHVLPLGRFDNRVDKTTFIRGDRSAWRTEEVKALDDELRRAFADIAGNR